MRAVVPLTASEPHFAGLHSVAYGYRWAASQDQLPAWWTHSIWMLALRSSVCVGVPAAATDVPASTAAAAAARTSAPRAISDIPIDFPFMGRRRHGSTAEADETVTRHAMSVFL